MGKYIIRKTVTNYDTHIIPNDLLFYDMRDSDSVWPNELFPYCVNWYWGHFRWKHHPTIRWLSDRRPDQAPNRPHGSQA